MSEININESNKSIIDKHFKHLVCDEYTESIFTGGQSIADEHLANIDIKGYSKKKETMCTQKVKEARLIFLPT
jgi:hypothetical protein